MESALIGRTLTSNRNRHPGVALTLKGERLTECRRQALGDDSGAGEMRARVEEVHVPAAATAKPGLTAEDLSRHRAQRNSVRNGQVVRPVGGGDGIIARQMRQIPAATGSWPAERCISP